MEQTYHCRRDPLSGEHGSLAQAQFALQLFGGAQSGAYPQPLSVLPFHCVRHLIFWEASPFNWIARLLYMCECVWHSTQLLNTCGLEKWPWVSLLVSFPIRNYSRLSVVGHVCLTTGQMLLHSAVCQPDLCSLSVATHSFISSTAPGTQLCSKISLKTPQKSSGDIRVRSPCVWWGPCCLKLSFSVHWSQIKSWRQNLGEVEKDSFIITMLGKGGPSGLLPQNCVPTWRG